MIEFFKEMQFLSGFSEHPNKDMNFTCAYFPMLIYLFAKIHGSNNILEVGTDIGYSSYYLASIAKENGGMYWAIEILPDMCAKVDTMLTEAELPHRIICSDTKTMDKLDFSDPIDIAWLDGEHTTAAVEHEVELIYPLLKSRGFGFIFIHDIVDTGNAEIWFKLTQDKRFESLGLEANYGLGILRKIDGVRYEEKAKMFGVRSL